MTREAYGYTDGNPLNSTDPSGMSTCGYPKNPLDVAGSLADCAVKAAQAAPEAAAKKVGGAVKTVGRCVNDAITCLDNMKKAVSPIVALGATVTVGAGLVLACATLIGCVVAAPVMVPAIVAGGYAT